MPDSAPELLVNHHVSHSVLELIENAKECVILVTAYIHLWPDLERAIQSALKRSVPVYCILREPDGSKRERDKARREIDRLKSLGPDVSLSPRLHAKVYLVVRRRSKETRAIVTSANLTTAGLGNNVELGVLAARTSDAGCKVVSEVRTFLERLVDSPRRSIATINPQGAA